MAIDCTRVQVNNKPDCSQFLAFVLCCACRHMSCEIADVFALGRILTMMCVNNPAVGRSLNEHAWKAHLYNQAESRQLYEDILRVIRALPNDQADLQEVLEGCLALEQENRWTIEQLMNCKWLAASGDGPQINVTDNLRHFASSSLMEIAEDGWHCLAGAHEYPNTDAQMQQRYQMDASIDAAEIKDDGKLRRRMERCSQLPSFLSGDCLKKAAELGMKLYQPQEGEYLYIEIGKQELKALKVAFPRGIPTSQCSIGDSAISPSTGLQACPAESPAMNLRRRGSHQVELQQDSPTQQDVREFVKENVASFLRVAESDPTALTKKIEHAFKPYRFNKTPVFALRGKKSSIPVDHIVTKPTEFVFDAPAHWLDNDRKVIKCFVSEGDYFGYIYRETEQCPHGEVYRVEQESFDETKMTRCQYMRICNGCDARILRYTPGGDDELCSCDCEDGPRAWSP